MDLEQTVARLQELAQASLGLWGLPDNGAVSLLNIAENITFLVEAAGGHKTVLRVHREGYHSRRAIECELAWLDVLLKDGRVTPPAYIKGINGEAVQNIRSSDGTEHRHAVLFEFIEGSAPDETGDMTEGYEQLGAIAANCHEQAIDWQRPQPFERLVWDVDAVFSPSATWGDWRAAPEVTEDVRQVLEQVEAEIRNRLAVYGTAPERYNLIHADMRLANLLVSSHGTRLIDFDDCGFGWLMYDFAAAISFIEDDPNIPAYKAAWLRGYRSVRTLATEDEAEIDTFIMLRRMALLAWIGSRIEAPEPQQLAPGFAATTARLGQNWLDALDRSGGR